MFGRLRQEDCLLEGDSHVTHVKIRQSCKNSNIKFTALRAKLSHSHELKLGSQRLNTPLLNE